MFITYQDKEYKLRYDFNAICEMEQKTGKGISAIMKEEAVGFSTIRLLLWAGLKHDFEFKNITLEKAGLIINELMQKGENLEDIATKCMSALVDSGLIGKNEGK